MEQGLDKLPYQFGHGILIREKMKSILNINQAVSYKSVFTPISSTMNFFIFINLTLSFEFAAGFESGLNFGALNQKRGMGDEFVDKEFSDYFERLFEKARSNFLDQTSLD